MKKIEIKKIENILKEKIEELRNNTKYVDTFSAGEVSGLRTALEILKI